MRKGTQNKIVLGIIPARGGSKGIKDKNIISILGKPLIAYTVESAGKSQLLTDTIVSTDSKKIANIAVKYGGRVPFLRPKKLAKDNTPTLPVLQHAVMEWERNESKKVGYVIVLQPTCPLRSSDDIDGCIDLLLTSGRHSVMTFYKAEYVHPYVMYTVDHTTQTVRHYLKENPKYIARQDFPDLYVRSGVIYGMDRKTLMEDGEIYTDECIPYLVPKLRSINIDEPFDVILVESALKAKDIAGENNRC